jgi:hypothetical protein
MREWPPKSFLGGHVVLDFLNTAGGDSKARDVDRFESFSDILTWAKASAIIENHEFSALEHIAAQSPGTAFQCLQEFASSANVFIGTYRRHKPPRCATGRP